jgi:polysaccharide deacetylase family protein (PEP-CTERM system associated)
MRAPDLVNAMTVDVEDYYHVSAFKDAIAPGDWDGMESRVEANTRYLLDTFDERGIKATFFVLGWVAERHPDIVREIVDGGHELACHGYSHQLIYTQTPERFREETLRAKGILEDLGQVPVRGYRAASYSITRKSEWALDILLEAGFTYDSSIFPVRHDNYGIPDADVVPHRIRTDAQGLVEFPLSTKTVGGWRIPIAGGGYFRLFPYGFTRWALDSINRSEELPFIFYLHPWEIDPDQPRIQAKWFSRFRHYNNLDRCRGRLNQLLDDFEFAPVSAVLEGMGLPV